MEYFKNALFALNLRVGVILKILMMMIFLKASALFIVVLLIVRLMGKRQIGEMQPFELVITLIIAEVACIPMNDPSIPLHTGIIPIITLAVLHIILSFLGRKSILVRQAVSGKSVIVVDRDGINYKNLQSLNMNIDDLIEAVRCAGYPDFIDICYAIFETNGKLCVIESQESAKNPSPAYLPVSILTDGKFIEKNLELVGATKMQIEAELIKKGISKPKDVALIDIRQDGTIYVSPKFQKWFSARISITGGENW